MKTEDVLRKKFDDVFVVLDDIIDINCTDAQLTYEQLDAFDRAYSALWDIRADLYRDTH